MTEPGANKTIGKWRRPGFLLEPLGWVQDRLSQAIEVEPRLVELLFDLDHARMHLTALALAHMSGDVTPDLALMLLQEYKKGDPESQCRSSPCRHWPRVNKARLTHARSSGSGMLLHTRSLVGSIIDTRRSHSPEATPAIGQCLGQRLGNVNVYFNVAAHL